MPILRPSASDATAIVKALAQYVPGGQVVRISKPSRDIYPVIGLGALARASRLGSFLSPTTTVLALTPSGGSGGAAAQIFNTGVVTSIGSTNVTTPTVAVLADGNLVIVDSYIRIKVVTYPAGVVTTLAGGAVTGSADGTGTAATFNAPYGVAVLPNGVIAVADSGNNRIRLVTYPGGVVTTLASTGVVAPYGIAVLPNGNLVVSSYSGHKILTVSYPGGVVGTLAGSGSPAFADGTGVAASFSNPYGLAVLPNGTIAVADASNYRIRIVTYPGGVVTTLAGTGSAAIMQNPTGVAGLSNGDVIVAEQSGCRILRVTSAGVITTLAGSGAAGFVNGTGVLAQFNQPSGVAVIPSTNVIVVADWFNFRIRVIT